MTRAAVTVVLVTLLLFMPYNVAEGTDAEKPMSHAVTLRQDNISYSLNRSAHPDELYTSTHKPASGDLGPAVLELHDTDCGKDFGKHKFKQREGKIVFLFSPALESQNATVVLTCDLELTVPEGMLAYLQVMKVSSLCNGVSVGLRSDRNALLYQGCPFYLPQTFVTYNRFLNVRVELLSLRSSFELHLNFTSIPESSQPHLEIKSVTPTRGHLETSHLPNYDGYPPFVDTRIKLSPPQGYSTVITIEMYINRQRCEIDSVCQDYVSFHSLKLHKALQVCNLPTYSYTDPLLFHGELTVQYSSFWGSHRASFRILFSFHNVSALPVQLGYNVWNCSNVHWPDMQQHFPCNFEAECIGGADEAGCWPAVGSCSQGQFEADGRCFSVSRVYLTEASSWSDASAWCRQRKAQLASLSTKKVWETTTSLLRRVRKILFVYIGAKSASSSVSLIYRNSLIWIDGTVAHFLKMEISEVTLMNTDACAILPLYWIPNSLGVMKVDVIFCGQVRPVVYQLCEIPGTSYQELKPPVLTKTPPFARFLQPAFIRCPSDHFTHVYLACDELAACWANSHSAGAACSPPLTSLPLPFQCASGLQTVPYTLVCDHRPDCMDKSDEDFCYFPPCDVSSPFQCSGKRCVQPWELCDGAVHCDDGADEERCPLRKDFKQDTISLRLPVRIDLTANQNFSYKEMQSSHPNRSLCPDSHFMCASLDQVCLPVYLRCNAVNDCPGHEDEAACDSYACPGFYRCRNSAVCVHESQVCDGVQQCPLRDDESLCEQLCPQNCACHGWAFICSGTFHAASHPNLRYLDVSGTAMTMADTEDNIFLVYLRLAHCNLSRLHKMTLKNLRSLDLSNNKLTHITSDHFVGLNNLQVLKISNNPLNTLTFQDFAKPSSLKALDMSGIYIPEINFDDFKFFSELETLNLSGAQLNHVKGQGFHRLSKLRALDLRGCPVAVFPRQIFQALSKLEIVFAENYRLCCSATLPSGFNPLNCHASSSDVSSCDDLLRSNLYRIGLAIFAFTALTGNIASLVYRLVLNKTAASVGYNVFVTNLSVADLLMGVYLSIIGIADHRYRGVYLWEDSAWRNSVFCSVAGFACLLSSEVSIFTIFLITCDRFLVLRFPFSQVHFRARSAKFTCLLTWLVSLILAAIPLLPMTSHWNFYAQTSICIPLPTSRAPFLGQTYSFAVIIVMNFIIFLFIFVGQIVIYWSIRSNSIFPGNTSKISKDSTIARRLITVVMSNFLCWFPVVLTGILAAHDVPIVGEVNVAVAIFVLPFNAAFNPFLYTANIYLERIRRKKEEERRKWILTQLKSDNSITGTGQGKGEFKS